MDRVIDSQSSGKGMVFNIQRFSVHDGPGIRTTVFMKGCPLSCRWCANPESQDFDPQLITRDIKCVGCGACAAVCPLGAISMNATEGREIDWDRCRQCLLCADACIYGALDRCGEQMTIRTVLDEVLSDRLFYQNSGGGVTVSGGEPLLQSEFVAGLLQTCKQAGLHTAIDTTGYVAWQKIQTVLPSVDLMLWDIKHLDAGAHKRTTGVGHRLILENLEKASKFVAIWLRMPLIEGFNDGEENIAAVIALARSVRAEKVSLLPYHEGGRSKNKQIGRGYPKTVGQPPSDKKIEAIKAAMMHAGLTVGVGN